ncbi:hypothetical protein Baya_10153 [Bagarius yarrelli]|uniref:Uncharacterized protein n=1 Tax=Bagarius yarrelli TaxID=175774 RepID=A0A556UF39_BAGYA|nr:hypothetical protein Baya_10153 [Bagarius yarrelli]
MNLFSAMFLLLMLASLPCEDWQAVKDPHVLTLNRSTTGDIHLSRHCRRQCQTSNGNLCLITSFAGTIRHPIGGKLTRHSLGRNGPTEHDSCPDSHIKDTASPEAKDIFNLSLAFTSKQEIRDLKKSAGLKAVNLTIRAQSTQRSCQTHCGASAFAKTL